MRHLVVGMVAVGSLILAGCGGTLKMGMFNEDEVRGVQASYCMDAMQKEACAGVHAGYRDKVVE